MTDYDLVVLGAGATGLGAAREARRKGARVALVEAERPGGDCTHYGCVPSKTLLESARRVQAARSGPAYGFRAEVDVDFPAVMDRVTAVIAEIEQDESPELLASEGIDLLRGWATFTSPTSARGRRAAPSPARASWWPPAAARPSRRCQGSPTSPYLDNRTVFGLRELPEHLLVLGGGPIGIELAQAFRRLGSQVTVVEGAPTVPGREEPEAQRALTAVLEREGVVLRTGAQVVRVGAGPVLHLDDGSEIARPPPARRRRAHAGHRGPGAGAAGARTDERGRVVTDARLQAAPTVWAAGDCTSLLQFTHVGDEQGRLAAQNAFGTRRPAAAARGTTGSCRG